MIQGHRGGYKDAGGTQREAKGGGAQGAGGTEGHRRGGGDTGALECQRPGQARTVQFAVTVISRVQKVWSRPQCLNPMLSSRKQIPSNTDRQLVTSFTSPNALHCLRHAQFQVMYTHIIAT